MRNYQRNKKLIDLTECPKELRENILLLCEGSKTSLKFIGETDIAIGELFASVVNTHLKKSKIDPASISAIGSHGQTVWHQPTGTHPFTMQLGDPSVISQRTGITTVAGSTPGAPPNNIPLPF